MSQCPIEGIKQNQDMWTDIHAVSILTSVVRGIDQLAQLIVQQKKSSFSKLYAIARSDKSFLDIVKRADPVYVLVKCC